MIQSIVSIFSRIFRKKRSTTVRTAFPVIFATIVIAAAAITATENTSRIVMETEPKVINSGEEFVVNISAIAHAPANTIDIEISYPEDKIEILGVDIGQSVISLWTEEPHWEDGVLSMSGGAFRKGFLGKHFIARVRARGIGTGRAVIAPASVLFLAGDGKGTEINTDETDSDSEVYIARDGENIDNEITGRLTINVITDLDGDGEVSFSDIAAFMSAWRSGSEIIDFNGDGEMTFRDFAIILSDSFFK